MIFWLYKNADFPTRRQTLLFFKKRENQMVLKKDLSWLNPATKVVQIPPALSPQHLHLTVHNVGLFYFEL